MGISEIVGRTIGGVLVSSFCALTDSCAKITLSSGLGAIAVVTISGIAYALIGRKAVPEEKKGQFQDNVKTKIGATCEEVKALTEKTSERLDIDGLMAEAGTVSTAN